jgi:flagellin-like hook-associated protein FlgL
MSDISLSKAVRSNLLSLQGTADLMARTQDRLATGNKVNSALDNPSNWFTAQGLNNRASDLGALLDSMANGVQTLEAADNGLTAMTKTLESMQSTLRQARQDKSFQTESFVMANIDANDPLLGQISFSGGSVTNTVGVDLIKTGAGYSAAMTGPYAAPTAAAKASIEPGSGVGAIVTAVSELAVDLEFSFDGGATLSLNLTAEAGRTPAEAAAAMQDLIDASPDYAGKITISEAAGVFKLETVGNVDGEFTVGGTDSAAFFGDPGAALATEQPVSVTGSNGLHEFTINGKKITLNATNGVDLETAIETINTQLGSDAKFEAYDALGGKIGIRAIKDNAGPLTIGGPDADFFGTPAGGVVAGTSGTLKFARTTDEMVAAINANTALKGNIRASNDNGKLRIENQSTQELTVEGKDADGAINGGTGTSTIGGNSVRTGLADQFNELRDQLDKLADDASFNGINLLRGDKLTITFNETGTSSIDIQTKGGDTINAANLGVPTSLLPEQLDSDISIDALLTDVKAALDQVRSQASTFGSNLSIVENRQTFTKSMVDTLQTGAGNLTLADMNEEAANLLALQTRQQLSQNSLSLASQADQSILQLLR